MKSFTKMSIKRKLRVIILVTSSIGLLITCSVLGIYDVIKYRRYQIDETYVLAKILAQKTAASLIFNDPQAAKEMLGSLALKPSIVSAYIFDRSNSLFTNYNKKDMEGDFIAPEKPASGWKFENHCLIVYSPVVMDGQTIGSVYIKSDLKEMYRLVFRYLTVLGVVLIISFLLIVTILSKLEPVIIEPIMDLSTAAKLFSDNRDYSIRVKKKTDDELGALVDAFNRMLEQIVARDMALIESKNQAELEVLKAKRLAEETKKANLELEREIAERKKAETQMRESEEKHRNLFESAPVGIVITTLIGEVLSYNTAFMAMFKIIGRDVYHKFNFSDFYADPENDMTKMMELLINQGEIENFVVNLKDTVLRIFPASLSLRLIQYEGRTCIQSIIRDITQIKKMEEELRNYAENLEEMVNQKTKELQSANEELSRAIQNLEETREQLSLSAHQAGMAEIAASVLHNIGNAINSVNVRTARLEEAVGARELGSMEKILGLLSAPDVVFGANGKDSGKKEKLISFFSTTIELLKNREIRFTKDLEFIRKGINHVMEIITIQQKYAGVRGYETQVNVNDLLYDSAEMLADSFTKRGIKVEFDLETIPQVALDKNKMIQIFINIMKNAYEAIDMGPVQNDKIIHVTTCINNLNSRRYIEVKIKDQGCGLTEEVRQEAFRFNFSTKGRGSGFGLHDSANYIRAQDGIIDILSPGPGNGAQVVIQIPIQKEQLDE